MARTALNSTGAFFLMIRITTLSGLFSFAGGNLVCSRGPRALRRRISCPTTCTKKKVRNKKKADGKPHDPPHPRPPPEYVRENDACSYHDSATRKIRLDRRAPTCAFSVCVLLFPSFYQHSMYLWNSRKTSCIYLYHTL